MSVLRVRTDTIERTKQMKADYKLSLKPNEMFIVGLNSTSLQRFKGVNDALYEAHRLNMKVAFVFRGNKLHGVYYWDESEGYIKLANYEDFE